MVYLHYSKRQKEAIYPKESSYLSLPFIHWFHTCIHKTFMLQNNYILVTIVGSNDYKIRNKESAGLWLNQIAMISWQFTFTHQDIFSMDETDLLWYQWHKIKNYIDSNLVLCSHMLQASLGLCYQPASYLNVHCESIRKRCRDANEWLWIGYKFPKAKIVKYGFFHQTQILWLFPAPKKLYI